MKHFFLSYSDGFPTYYIAANTKIRFISKGLIEQGDSVVLLNKFYSINNNAPAYGVENGVAYYSLPKEKSKIKGAFLNTIRAIRLLKKEYKKGEQNIAYIGAGNFFILCLLSVAARIRGYKVALIQEEFQAGLELPFLNKVNGYLHSYYLGYFVNYILPISEYLANISKKYRKPMFKLPICADFSIASANPAKVNEPYFLYCASALYHRAFDFVLDSFEILARQSNNVKLHLVLSGKKEFIKEDIAKINKRGLSDRVIVMTQLPYDELLNQYNNASALLIPLFSDQIGDVARFSQKISEYLSTKRPVISTNVGEVKFYFTDGENMLIAEHENPECFADKMKFVIMQPEQALQIGCNGYDYGKSKFDYKVITKDLVEFLK